MKAFLLFIIAGVVMMADTGASRAEDRGKLPDRVIYYEEDKGYRAPDLAGGVIKQDPNTWVKRCPIPGGPPSPKLGYEGSVDYDNGTRRLIRHAGHNQGGGGEQGFETWLYDPVSGKWTLMYPNTSPPGTCCSRTNVIDQSSGKFIRFPGFSGHHGWQWRRHILNLHSSVWAYDPKENFWINMRPYPEVSVGPARAAAYDPDDQIILVFNVNEQGKTAAYDLYTNTWTLLNPANEPPEKTFYTPGFNMTYDRSQKLFVLFGAGQGTDPRTFTFDIRKNAWKVMQPQENPTYYEADPVMAYDSKNKVNICLVANKEKKRLETWAYEAGSDRWKKMDPPQEPDATGNRQRLLAYAPDQDLIILENRWSPGYWRTNEQQIWTYRYAAASPEDALKPPGNVKLVTTEKGAGLSWDPVDGAEGYNVYHGTGEKPWLVDYAKIASVRTNGFTHENIEKNKIHYYYLAASAGDRESPAGLKVRSQPAVITDIVVTPLSMDRVELEWKAHGEDIAGYNIYRAPTTSYNMILSLKAGASFKRVNKELVSAVKFTDDVALDKVYAYRVQAVNRLGVEGGPSPFVFTIPSPPQYIYSREDGNDCRLTWRRNPEKSVIGYNIYRTRKDKFDDRHDLVNEEPVKAESFIDVNAMKDMPKAPANTGRRYYITAVDFLGQESFPSSPVWFYREWSKFYKVGEWHQ